MDDVNFDPDSDDFKFSFQHALALHHNLNILQFVRRNLGVTGNPSAKAKQFNSGVEYLTAKLTQEREDLKQAREKEEGAKPKSFASLLPLEWDSAKHDKALMTAVAKHGFNCLSTLPGNEELGFGDIREDHFIELQDGGQNLREVTEATTADSGLRPLSSFNGEPPLVMLLFKRVEEICNTFKDQIM